MEALKLTGGISINAVMQLFTAREHGSHRATGGVIAVQKHRILGSEIQLRFDLSATHDNV
ncbi:hypothetical protein GCM10008940_34380 [Microbulbifer agarilyticus]